MKRCLKTITVVAAAIALAFAARGTTCYWDNNGSAIGFGSAGGIWGLDTLWSVDSSGASTPGVLDTTVDDDLHLGTDINGLAEGTITVQGTNQGFKTLRFGAASGELTLSGGTLNLASPSSSIIVNSPAGTNTVGSVLAGNTALQLRFNEVTKLTYSSYLTESSATAFASATLARYVRASGTIGGGWVPGGAASIFHFSNNGTTATYQLQVLHDATVKCVKVALEQVGADITARAVYAKNSSEVQLGFDFDSGGNVSPVATSPASDGYGVALTEIFADCTFALKLAGRNTYTGDTTISNGILRLDGAGQLGGGSYSGSIANSGVLHFNSNSNQVFSGAITGRGALQKSAVAQSPFLLIYANNLPRLPNNQAAVIIAQDLRVADCTPVSGFLGGPSITGGRTSGEVFFFKNDGATATWQLQTTNNAPYTKCVKVELRQVGADISARVLYAAYVSNNSVLGFDFDSGGTHGADYQAAETTLSFTPTSKLTLSGANSYAGGTIVDGGTLEAAATASALPATGGIVINNGGELLLNVSGILSTTASVGGSNPITINQGGTLTISKNFNAGYNRQITANGGTINSTVLENTDNSNYMNKLTLMNGATIKGSKIRVGYESAATITVSGTNTCSIPAGINMVKRNSEPLTFNVADATGDAAPDLIVSGVIKDYNEDLASMPIVKTGAGTLSFTALNTHIGVININQGSLALDGNSTLNTGNPVVLNGGALEMGAFTNSVGTLALSSSNSTVVLGSGRIAFANSSAVPWSGNLTLSGTLVEKSMRFGSDNTALTLGQLAAISCNDSSVRLDSDGYLFTPPPGMLIMVK